VAPLPRRRPPRLVRAIEGGAQPRVEHGDIERRGLRVERLGIEGRGVEQAQRLDQILHGLTAEQHAARDHSRATRRDARQRPGIGIPPDGLEHAAAPVGHHRAAARHGLDRHQAEVLLAGKSSARAPA